MQGVDDCAAPDLPAPVFSVVVEASLCAHSSHIWPCGLKLRWLWRAVCGRRDGGRRCGSVRVWWLFRGGHYIRGSGEGFGGRQRGCADFRLACPRSVRVLPPQLPRHGCAEPASCSVPAAGRPGQPSISPPSLWVA
ncbi:hypothetical protein ACQJBY_058115 [Aegilops geniculata]